MDSRWSRVGLVAALSLCVRLVEGADAATTTTVKALSVPPSASWYGDDGTWSAISIRVGNPLQWMDVMVSTVSSETWVVGPGGCAAGDSTCSFTRGGIFDASKSSTWQNQGLFELGADKQLGNTGYAQYGLDNLTFGGTGVMVPSSIIGAFNGTGPISGTSYLLGLFGLGVVPGSFNNTSPLSALSALVETVGGVPSHSWGYTAGAKYQQKGVVNSLTLGGYDSNRFIPHNVSFNLNTGKQLLTFVNSISVASSAASNNWTKPVQLLSATDRVSAIIDSSTPYLWLPQAVCERFAQSLGLTYNTALNLYTFDANQTQHDTLGASSLSFTFSLSDISSTPATVDITLPYAAFDLQLTYPAIPFTNFGGANSTKYYFPLRQASNEAQYTIGRAFLQEAYVITDYERNTFSVHQAIHPTDSVGNTSIVSISPPGDSTFSGVPAKSGSKLSAGAIAGIAIGAVLFLAISAFLTFFLCRRKRQNKQTDTDSEKPFSSQTPQRSLLSRLLNRNHPPAAGIHEASGSSSYPTEVGADATHERFELPAPLGPAELESESTGTGSLDGTTEHGTSTQDSANLSAYERARRKLERQQAAAFALSSSARETYPVEKSDADISHVAHYRAPDSPNIDIDSPLVSPIVDSHSQSAGSLTISGQNSPVSPGFVSAPTSPAGPPPTYRRFNLNPSNVVYAGRLPDNVQLPRVVPRIIGRDGRTIRAEETLATESSAGTNGGTSSSLGSQFTEHESEDLYGSGSGGTNIISPIASGSASGSAPGGVNTDPISSLDSTEGTRTQLREENTMLSRNMSMLDPWGSRRRLDGEDLVHVPQPAENRFSWEEERISGTEEERSL
ncbi:aspartic peptidase domain-containing protein [Rhexocercosporidium sp. MPI-PUGE-AT-0058]|nr:aspartic peptidase domain-containing protein [Rhexocercosporidium sp. MPI-PUGE-AT-0058]